MASITRAEVATLIQEEYGPYVLKAAEAGSTALAAFPKVNMGTKVANMPVLATLPEAEWVGDTDNTDVKTTSKATWGNKKLVAEEIAVIVPVHENTLDDATEDILQELASLGGQAIGKTLDQACLFGVNKPASWTSDDLFTAAVKASQVQQVATGEDDLYGSIIKAARLVSTAGFSPSALIAHDALRLDLMNLRGGDGHLLLTDDGIRGFSTTYFNRNGAWSTDQAIALAADPSLVRIGIRQDVTVKLLDQASITGLGNLAELDMVALRFKARFAYVLGKVATAKSVGDDDQKTPVAAVIPAAE